MTDDELVGAGISAKERLERIEALLDRMDRKLDSKVDQAEFLSLDARVRDLELHGSQATRDLVVGCSEMTGTIVELRESHNALKVRIAYAAGAAAVVVVAAEWLLARVNV